MAKKAVKKAAGKKAAVGKKDGRATRREWTEKDIGKLREMAGKKKAAGTIANVLKRSVGATRQKAFTLGLSLSSR